ncbi:MAG: dodecin family protein [Thioalkalivibrio sp.]|nr:dodecin family protein [Thioalkalivibrio sp.]
MSVAKIMEISAESPVSFEDAIRSGIVQAAKTVTNIRGASVANQKLKIENGQIAGYRVDMRVTFAVQ